MKTSAPTGFDPKSDDFVRDPVAAFARAREQAPVFYYEPLDMWVITRFADLDHYLADFEALSHKTLASTPVPEDFRDRIPQGFFADSWIALDPPEHTQPRKVAQRGFTRPKMLALEPRIGQIANGLIDSFEREGECDLMDRYCYPLTIRTLCLLFGLDESWEPFMRRLAKTHIKVLNTVIDPMDEPERSEVWGAYADSWDELREVVDNRITGPGEDIISEMATARGPDGEPLMRRDRVVFHCCEIAFAGSDTTANLMANALVFLSADPEQMELVQSDPSLWPAVVDETLRRRPSVAAVPRMATRELEIAGTTIPEGARVWMALAGAGGDDEHYEEPERFDITRARPDDHLSFGKGRHFCMGAPLARAQGRIGLQTLMERLPSLRILPGQELEFINNVGAPSRHTLRAEWTIPG
ncbi:MAG TPA: cytochrome P450 [Thermoleophilaceae bacterium]